MTESSWPSLSYEKSRTTLETLHLVTQIVGKVKVAFEWWVNHSWSSALLVTPSGFTTSSVCHGDGAFSIDLDLIRSLVNFSSSDGKKHSFPLRPVSISNFYNKIIETCRDFGIDVTFDPYPNEVQHPVSFLKDTRPRIYDPEQARNFFGILVRSHNVLKKFRSSFIGKCSPVHFFWGSFDLAVTRFSGRRAPEHPGGVLHLPDRVTREAYSHEVSSCGFWPGNSFYPEAAFYSYAYPAPAGFSEAKVPEPAFFHPQLREFVLPYERLRETDNPTSILEQFLQATYEGAANLGHWDRELLEVSPYREACQEWLVNQSRNHQPKWAQGYERDLESERNL